jgi:3',5'-cyclic AMP phosphodiesterase CpdA
MALRFREDKSLTIVQFTDVHYQNGDELDQRSRALMERVLDAEQPDLVVYTGDLIESLKCDDPLWSIRQPVSVAEERQIPWAAVFGNHDSEKGSRAALGQALQSGWQHSLFEPGPADLHGVGNYRIPVYGQGGQEAASLWFFDSGAYAPWKIGHYEWIHLDQIHWYLRESAKTAHLPALAFFHIPLPEYKKVWRYRTCYGHKNERINAPWLNTGLFCAMALRGDVIGTFCGHDHVNDYWGELRGIRLCYGRATGYNTYGKEGFPRGARIIRLYEGERRFDTWLRLDDGTVVHNQPAHQWFQK